MEALILWQEDPESKILEKTLADTSRFERQGNFYKVKCDFIVFGYPATYLGLLGVDLLAGPNAMLRASPKDIASSITQQYGYKFEHRWGVYSSNIKKNIRIHIEEHPDLPGQSMVIGSYEGP